MKHSTPKPAEESDPKPEERVTMVSDLTGSLRLTEAGSKLFEDTDSNKQTKN